MSIRPLTFGICLLLSLNTSLNAVAQDAEAKPKETNPALEPVGYFLGLSVGQQMRQSGFRIGDFDLGAVLVGFEDGLGDEDSALTDDQLKDAQAQIQALLQKRRQEMLAQKLKEAEAFLAENAKKEGVKTLEGGVQYKVIKSGKGSSPSVSDTITVNYTGKLVSGEIFDTTAERGEPATFRLGNLIPGWKTALQKMKPGDKWVVYIPPQLGYGENGSPPVIGPNAVLIFELELIAAQ